MENMISTGTHAILVKVAAMGLKPDKHLGKELATIKEHLVEIHEEFGCHICGEGGEYETLVLDCPLFQFGRIVIDSSVSVRDKETGDIAPSGVLDIQSFHVERKYHDSGSRKPGRVYRVPLDSGIEEVSKKSLESINPSLERDAVVVSLQETEALLQFRVRISDGIETGSDVNWTQNCLFSMLTRLQEELATREVSLEDAAFVHLFLRDMDHFAAANQVYCGFFPSVNPPSRACVQVALMQSCAVDFLVFKKSEKRKVSRSVIHVQSISSWAPPCIGPYSQATSLEQISFIAGQLGLIPTSMTFDERGWKQEVMHALRHCQSISVALRGDSRKSTIKVVVYFADAFISQLNDEDRNELKSLIDGHWIAPDQKGPLYGGATGSESDSVLDSYLRVPDFDFRISPVVSYITVPALPKKANIEIQPILLNERGNPASASPGLESVHQGSAMNCTLKLTHEWRSTHLGSPIKRLAVQLDSDHFVVKPHAQVLLQCSGFSIIQVHIPALIHSDARAFSDIVRDACLQLVKVCLHVCSQGFADISSSTLWYNAGNQDKLSIQKMISGIRSSMTKESGTEAQLTCLPSNGIGCNVWLSDMILIDCITLSF